MKRRSAPKASRSRPEPLTYFTDRDLAKQFPARLADAGVQVISYNETFPNNPMVEDRDWIRRACSEGWVCLTHDLATRKEENTLDVVFEPWRPSGALFLLRGGISTVQLAEMFLAGLAKVERMVRKHRQARQPFIGRIRRMPAKGGQEEIQVLRWANHDEWVERQRRRLRR